MVSRSSQRIKLIDFGLSRKLKPGLDNRAMMGTAEFVGKFSIAQLFILLTILEKSKLIKTFSSTETLPWQPSLHNKKKNKKKHTWLKSLLV